MPIQVSNTWDYWIDLCKINAYEQMLTELKAQKSIQLSSNSPSLLGHCIGPNFFHFLKPDAAKFYSRESCS